MKTEELKKLVLDALEDMKALDVITLDVRDISSMTDIMVIATGTSNTHTKSVASYVFDKAKAAGMKPLGMEGEDQGEWVLVDLGDIVVHVMKHDVRDFYNLEKLWSMSEETGESRLVQ
ncbi:MAG: ribosome silencing factor [Gammaproteobacteria bacterium]|nr:ribosome silencing factor [Gammaproteobacteria bacterium]